MSLSKAAVQELVRAKAIELMRAGMEKKSGIELFALRANPGTANLHRAAAKREIDRRKANRTMSINWFPAGRRPGHSRRFHAGSKRKHASAGTSTSASASSSSSSSSSVPVMPPTAQPALSREVLSELEPMMTDSQKSLARKHLAKSSNVDSKHTSTPSGDAKTSSTSAAASASASGSGSGSVKAILDEVTAEVTGRSISDDDDDPTTESDDEHTASADDGDEDEDPAAIGHAGLKQTIASKIEGLGPLDPETEEKVAEAIVDASGEPKHWAAGIRSGIAAVMQGSAINLVADTLAWNAATDKSEVLVPEEGLVDPGTPPQSAFDKNRTRKATDLVTSASSAPAPTLAPAPVTKSKSKRKPKLLPAGTKMVCCIHGAQTSVDVNTFLCVQCVAQGSAERQWTCTHLHKHGANYQRDRSVPCSTCNAVACCFVSMKTNEGVKSAKNRFWAIYPGEDIVSKGEMRDVLFRSQLAAAIAEDYEEAEKKQAAQATASSSSAASASSSDGLAKPPAAKRRKLSDNEILEVAASMTDAEKRKYVADYESTHVDLTADADEPTTPPKKPFGPEKPPAPKAPAVAVAAAAPSQKPSGPKKPSAPKAPAVAAAAAVKPVVVTPVASASSSSAPVTASAPAPASAASVDRLSVLEGEFSSIKGMFAALMNRLK